MTLTVDNPILNSPFREPERYWLYDAAAQKRAAVVSGAYKQAMKHNARDIGCPDRSLGITRHEAEFRPLAAAE